MSRPRDYSTDPPRIHFDPHPRYHRVTVEDFVESPNDLDDDDGIPHSSSRQEELPQVQREQIHTRNKPRAESSQPGPVSQRETPTDHITDRTIIHYSRSRSPLAPARPPIHPRRTSHYGQPLVHSSRFLPQSRESSRGPSIRARVSIPESTSELPYPSNAIRYPSPPKIRSSSSHWDDSRSERFYERPEYHPRRSSTYSRHEYVSGHNDSGGFNHEGFYEPIMTPALAQGPRTRVGDVQYGVGDIDASQDEDMMDFEQMTAKKRDEEVTKIRQEFREELMKSIEAESRAAVQAKEAETMRNEESAKLVQEKMVQGIDEIMTILKKKIHQELGTKKQTDTGNHAKRDKLRAEVQAEVEGVATHPGDLSESPAPDANPPHSLPLPDDGEPLPRRPPDAPEPPDTYAETKNEGPTMAFPGRQMRRLWRLEQEERSRERKERRTLRMIWEELGFPIAETLAAGLAGAAYGYAPPMPPTPSFHQHPSPHSSRASGSRLHSTYRQFSSDPGPSYAESESDDATYSPRRYRRGRKRSKSRGKRPLRRGVERLQHEAELSSLHNLPAGRIEEDASAQRDSSMLAKVEPRPLEITAKAEPENGRENIEENVEELTGNDTNDAVKTRTLLGDHIVTFAASIVAVMPLGFWFDFALMEISLRLEGALNRYCQM
ncbi:hypothetical protein F4818DRAFT_444341 [Hypoxylon cercidicola]|nr:hypothetical protein F4818DRAFT_444341 [Hypoxylon cercidicola]